MTRGTFVRRSRRLTRRIRRSRTEERCRWRIEGLPEGLRLSWLDPSEVRVEFVWMSLRISILRVYPIAWFQFYRFFRPGRRPSEERSLRQWFLWHWSLSWLGVLRSHSFRVPRSWDLLTSLSYEGNVRSFSGPGSEISSRTESTEDQERGEWIEGRPRRALYMSWWSFWGRVTVRRVHLPWFMGRLTKRWRFSLVEERKEDPSRLTDLTEYGDQGLSRSLGSLRRWRRMGWLRMSAVIAPPDRRSQRRLTRLGMRIWEIWRVGYLFSFNLAKEISP